MRYPKWTDSEDRILVDNQHGLLSDICKLLPNRKPTSIRRRCKKLKVFNDSWNIRHKKIIIETWSKTDIEYLQNNYNKMKLVAICNVLNKTKQCIKNQAYLLKLTSFHKKFLWKGHGEIGRDFWTKMIKSANKRNIKFEISIEQMWDLFLKQDRKCALSGLDIKFYCSYKDRTKTTASIDRIDSSKDYTIDNVQWVHKHINYMKQSYSQDYFKSLCKAVVENN